MKDIVMDQRSVYKGNLILVNRDNPIRERLAESDLVPVSQNDQGILLCCSAQRMLQKLISALGAHDMIVPVSGYRSAEEQRDIFESSMRENGAEFTNAYVAPVNASEHQTGLAIDLGENMPDIDFIRPSFPYHGICQKFRQSAPFFGFVERYSEDKTSITGIAHEPWHFRYVGVPHSLIMARFNMALEEYIDYLRQFTYDSGPLVEEMGDKIIKIYYASLDGHASKALSIPADRPAYISGNNNDGLIITVWDNAD